MINPGSQVVPPDSQPARDKRILVTGAAGFIGFHLARNLLSEGYQVLGIDAITDYYDVGLKNRRLSHLTQRSGYIHSTTRLENSSALLREISEFSPSVIVHLAAQAGVRYALENPRSYVESNILGTFNILEAARLVNPRHLLLASTSSVYGASPDLPFREAQRTDHPLSFYAATKKATEDLAHSYAHLHQIPTTSFRFFTVYGPWGRPDMALFKFASAILNGSHLTIHDDGLMRRDFTYIDDLVAAVRAVIPHAPAQGAPVSPRDSLSPDAPFRSLNIGGGNPITVMRLVEALEKATGRTALLSRIPSAPGESPITSADSALLSDLVGRIPTTDIDTGVERFMEWYESEYLQT